MIDTAEFKTYYITRCVKRKAPGEILQHLLTDVIFLPATKNDYRYTDSAIEFKLYVPEAVYFPCINTDVGNDYKESTKNSCAEKLLYNIQLLHEPIPVIMFITIKAKKLAEEN